MSPLYSFRDDQGQEVELFFGMDEVAEIGATIVEDGQTLTRAVSAQSGICKEYRHVSHQLPRVDPKEPYWPHYDSRNRPVCTSRKQVKELEARVAALGSQFKYDN